MTDKLYSVKEIADQCGVTKQTVFNAMDEVFRVRHTHKVGNRQMIDEAGMTALVAHFVKSISIHALHYRVRPQHIVVYSAILLVAAKNFCAIQVQ